MSDNQPRDDRGRWASEGGSDAEPAGQMFKRTPVGDMFSKKQKKQILDIVARHDYVDRAQRAERNAREAS